MFVYYYKVIHLAIPFVAAPKECVILGCPEGMHSDRPNNLERGVAFGEHPVRKYSGADDFLHGYKWKNNADTVPVPGQERGTCDGYGG